MCSERRKNHGCGQKKPKSTSSAIFGVETAAKSCELKRCADRVRTDEANLNFSPELYRLNFFRLNWTFPLPPKRQLSILLNYFFPLTNLFLTFVVFAATTRVNMRFRAKNTRDSAQGYIQCMKCIGIPVVRMDGRTDVRMYGRTSRDYYVTAKISWLDRLPNFLSNGHDRKEKAQTVSTSCCPIQILRKLF